MLAGFLFIFADRGKLIILFTIHNAQYFIHDRKIE